MEGGVKSIINKFGGMGSFGKSSVQHTVGKTQILLTSVSTTNKTMQQISPIKTTAKTEVKQEIKEKQSLQSRTSVDSANTATRTQNSNLRTKYAILFNANKEKQIDEQSDKKHSWK